MFLVELLIVTVFFVHISSQTQIHARKPSLYTNLQMCCQTPAQFLPRFLLRSWNKPGRLLFLDQLVSYGKSMFMCVFSALWRSSLQYRKKKYVFVWEVLYYLLNYWQYTRDMFVRYTIFCKLLMSGCVVSEQPAW